VLKKDSEKMEIEKEVKKPVIRKNSFCKFLGHKRAGESRNTESEKLKRRPE